ncbi:MAG TPA: AAA family ATPase, partial [Candidatus Limnocylindria bacterium]|nr:AAA family ATPase [Candidatus Limnocylindria bacterium]
MSTAPTTGDAPKRLSLRLLGSPLVEVDGAAVETDTRKAIALLAYLAVTGAPQSREALAALLWPEHDQAHAGAALRRTLSVARSALGGHWLAATGRLLRLDEGGLRCDVVEARALLHAVAAHHHLADPACDRCRRRLERAVALHRGPFLDGFSLRDSPEFDDWQAATAADLHLELAEALQRLSDGWAAAGRLDLALRHARRWLTLDPLHEPAHRRLMELFAAAGDRASAQRQYRECVRVLDDELGVAPLPETTATYEGIAAGEALAVPSSPRSPSPLARPPLPFVGRAAELARLAAVYDASAEGGRVALVEGEAGIGKSRLAEELAALVASSGGRVIVTRGYPAESSLAFASMADALRQAARHDPAWAGTLSGHVRDSAAQLVPELAGAAGSGGSPATLAADGARARLLGDLASGLVAALAGTPPGMLLVDDAQWLDASSAEVLAHLVRRIGEHRICVVICRRSQELASDALETLRRDARRGGVIDEVPLRRLDAGEVAALAAASGQAAQVASALFERSEGIPFFVVEYLELLRSRDSADAEAGELPQGIRDLVSSRLQGVSAEARQVLTAAAVIGRSFGLALVREVSGRSVEETVRALEERRGDLRSLARCRRQRGDLAGVESSQRN